MLSHSLHSTVVRETQRVTRGLSARKNDSCDHFVLITQNKPRSLFIKGEQTPQCPLTKKSDGRQDGDDHDDPQDDEQDAVLDDSGSYLRNIPVRIRELFPKFASVSRSRSRARCILSLS